MYWEDRIVCDPKILLGKPTIKGTRLSVAFILERLADGWTEKMLYENYPRLTPADLQAIFAYASECMNDDFAFNKNNRH
ncbi:MAG: DUF433 domain-containing protein [Pyrinomonadaceae bacterium]